MELHALHGKRSPYLRSSVFICGKESIVKSLFLKRILAKASTTNENTDFTGTRQMVV
jgi:hypothetical protein